jgi:hypothetical protein
MAGQPLETVLEGPGGEKRNELARQCEGYRYPLSFLPQMRCPDQNVLTQAFQANRPAEFQHFLENCIRLRPGGVNVNVYQIIENLRWGLVQVEHSKGFKKFQPPSGRQEAGKYWNRFSPPNGTDFCAQHPGLPPVRNPYARR